MKLSSAASFFEEGPMLKLRILSWDTCMLLRTFASYELFRELTVPFGLVKYQYY